MWRKFSRISPPFCCCSCLKYGQHLDGNLARKCCYGSAKICKEILCVRCVFLQLLGGIYRLKWGEILNGFQAAIITMIMALNNYYRVVTCWPRGCSNSELEGLKCLVKEVVTRCLNSAENPFKISKTRVVGGGMKFEFLFGAKKWGSIACHIFGSSMQVLVFTVLILTIRDFIKISILLEILSTLRFQLIIIWVHCDFNFARKFKFEVWLSFIYLIISILPCHWKSNAL